MRCCEPASTSGRSWAAAAGWAPHHVAAPAAQHARRLVYAQASKGNKSSSSSTSKGGKQTNARHAQLYELDADGWGVDVAPASSPSVPPQQQQPQAGRSKPATNKQTKASSRRASLSTQTPQGALSLALLQSKLLEAEAAQAEVSPEDVTALKQQISDLQLATGDDPQQQQKGGSSRLLANSVAAAQEALVAKRAAAAAGAAAAGWEEEEGEGDDWDEDAEPEYQLTFEPDGRMTFTDFKEGMRQARPALPSSSSSAALALANAEEAAAGEAEEEEEWDPSQRPLQPSAALAAPSKAGREATQLALLQDAAGEDDWGLEGLEGRGGGRGGPGGRRRRSLVEELTEQEEAVEDGLGVGGSGQVTWGGTGGVTGLDLEEQEALLQRYFRPAQVARLMQQQREVDRDYSTLKRQATGDIPLEHKLHRSLRIISGSAAGKKLLSSRGAQTRPMMDKVRQAVFNSVLSMAGSVNVVPPGSRWLDLFAGTGSVGLEALSRGAAETHFVEMDPWVVKKVLGKNIDACGFRGRSLTHTSKAEEFLRRAKELPRFAGGAFDFISMCPPYLLVSYPELFQLLEGSPLIHPGTILFVEYAKQLSDQVPLTVGPLQRVRNKAYGRTWIAVYAAAEEEEASEEEMGEVSSLLEG